MSLKRYYIDLRKLSSEERKRLYDILEKQSFTISVDLKNIGLYEVFWDNPKSITEIIQFPQKAIITQI